MQSSIIQRAGVRSSADAYDQFRDNIEQLLHSAGIPSLLSRRGGLAGLIGSGGGQSQSQIGQQQAYAAVDIIENPEAYVALVEVPGLTETDIEINVVGQDSLTIRAQRQPPHAVQSNQNTVVLLSERTYGQVQRTFQLPQNINRDQIRAEVNNGLLTLTIPKTQDAQNQKKIQVQRGTASSGGRS